MIFLNSDFVISVIKWFQFSSNQANTIQKNNNERTEEDQTYAHIQINFRNNTLGRKKEESQQTVIEKFC